VDEVVRDYPLNVQWVGNRGTITFTHLRARAEPLFDKLFRDDPDRGSCDILLEAAQAVGRPECASRPGQHGDPDRIGGPIWGKLWVRSASASQLTTPSCPARNASGAVDSTSVWSSPGISMRRA